MGWGGWGWLGWLGKRWEWARKGGWGRQRVGNGLGKVVGVEKGLGKG